MNPNSNDVVVNVGTDSSEARVDIRRLESSIKSLEASTRNIRDFKHLAQSASQVRTETTAATASMSQMGGQLSSLTALAASFTAAITAALTLSAYHKMADEATRLQNRLRLVHKEQLDVIAAQERLYKIARSTRGDMTGMGDLYYRLSQSAKENGRSQAEVLRSVEAIQLSARISGSSTESAAAAITQLNQGLASGTLRGEELNSVMEQLPRMAEAIAAHLGVSVGKLRGLAEQGQITSSVVFNAMLSQAGALREEFARTQVTAAEGFTQVSLAVTKITGEFDSITRFSEKFAKRMLLIADTINTVTPTLKTMVFEVRSLVDSTYLDFKAGMNVEGVDPADLLRINTMMADAMSGKNPFETKPDTTPAETAIRFVADTAELAFDGISDMFSAIFASSPIQITERLRDAVLLVFYAGKSVVETFKLMGQLIPVVFGPAYTAADYLGFALGRASARFDVFTRAQRAMIRDFVMAKIEAGSFFTLFDQRIERSFRALFTAGSLKEAVEAMKSISGALATYRGGIANLRIAQAASDLEIVKQEIRTFLVLLDLAPRRIIAIENIRFDKLIYGLGVVKTILTDLYKLTIGKALTILGEELTIVGQKIQYLAMDLIGLEPHLIQIGGTGIGAGIVEQFNTLHDSISSGINGISKLFNSGSLYDRFDEWLAGDGGLESVIKRLSLAGVTATVFRFNIPLAIAFSILTMEPVRKALAPVFRAIEEYLMDSPLGPAIEFLANTVTDAYTIVHDALAPVVTGLRDWFGQIRDTFLEFFGFATGGLVSDTLNRIADALSDASDSVRKALGGATIAEQVDEWLNGSGGIDSIVKQLVVTAASMALFRFNVPLAIAFSAISVSPIRKMLLPVFNAIEEMILNFNISDVFSRVFERLSEFTETFGPRFTASLSRLMERMSFRTSSGLNGVMQTVLDFTEGVDRAFFRVMDAVVGHSWWPDLVDGVIDHAHRLRDVALRIVERFTDGVNDLFYRLQATPNLDLFASWMESGSSDSQMTKVLAMRYAGVAATVLGFPAIGIPLTLAASEEGRDVLYSFTDTINSWSKSLESDPLKYMAISAREIKNNLMGTTFFSSLMDYAAYKVDAIAKIIGLFGVKFHLLDGMLSNMSTLDLLKDKFENFRDTVSDMLVSVGITVDMNTLIAGFGRALLVGAALFSGPVWLKLLAANNLQDLIESHLALPLIDSIEYVFGVHLPSAIADFVGNTLGAIAASMIDTFPATLEHIIRSIPSMLSSFMGQFGPVPGFFGNILAGFVGLVSSVIDIIPGGGLLMAALFGFVGTRALRGKDKLASAGEAFRDVFELVTKPRIDSNAGFLGYNKALMKLGLTLGILGPMLSSSVSGFDGLAAAIALGTLSIMGTDGIRGALTYVSNGLKSLRDRFVDIKPNNAFSGLRDELDVLASRAAFIFEGNRAAMNRGDMSPLQAATTVPVGFPALNTTKLKESAAAAGQVIMTAMSWPFLKLPGILAAALTSIRATITAIKSTVLGAFLFKAAIATAIVLLGSFASSAHAATEQVSVMSAGFTTLAAQIVGAIAAITAAVAFLTLKDLRRLPKDVQTLGVFFTMFAARIKAAFIATSGILAALGTTASFALAKLLQLVLSTTPALSKMAAAMRSVSIASVAMSINTARNALLVSAVSIIAAITGPLRLASVVAEAALRRVGMGIILFVSGLKNLYAIGSAVVLFFSKLGLVMGGLLAGAIALGAGLIGLMLFGEGDTLTKKITNLGYAIKEAIFPAAKAWKEAVPDRDFGDTKFNFADRIDTLDIAGMTDAEQMHFERVNARVGQVMEQTQQFYDTQGYLTAEQNEAALRAYAEWNRVYALAGKKETTGDSLSSIIRSAEADFQATARSRIVAIYKFFKDLVGPENFDAIASALGSTAAGMQYTVDWLWDSLKATITAIGGGVEQAFLVLWDVFMMAGNVINHLLRLDIVGALMEIVNTLVSVVMRVFSVIGWLGLAAMAILRPVIDLVDYTFFSGEKGKSLTDQITEFFSNIYDSTKEGVDRLTRVALNGRNKGLTDSEKASEIVMGNGEGLTLSNELARDNLLDQLDLFSMETRDFVDPATVKKIEDAVFEYKEATDKVKSIKFNTFDVDPRELEQAEAAVKRMRAELEEMLYAANQEGMLKRLLNEYETDISGFLKRIEETGGQKMKISELLFGGDDREAVDALGKEISDELAKLKTFAGTTDETAVPIRVSVKGMQKARDDIVKFLNEVASFDGELNAVTSNTSLGLKRDQVEDLFLYDRQRYEEAVSLIRKLEIAKANQARLGAKASDEEKIRAILNIRAVSAELEKLKPIGTAIAETMRNAFSEIGADNVDLGLLDAERFAALSDLSEKLKQAKDDLKSFEENQRKVQDASQKLSVEDYYTEWKRLNNEVEKHKNGLKDVAMSSAKLISSALGSIEEGPEIRAMMATDSVQEAMLADSERVAQLRGEINSLVAKGKGMTSEDRAIVRSKQTEIFKTQGKWKSTLNPDKERKSEKKEYKNIFERFTEHFKKNGNIDIKLEDFGLASSSMQRELSRMLKLADQAFQQLDEKTGILPANADLFRERLQRFNEVKQQIEDTIKRANFDNFWADISKDSGIDLGTAIDRDLFKSLYDVNSELETIARLRKKIAPESDGSFSDENLKRLQELSVREAEATDKRMKIVRDNQSLEKMLTDALSSAGVELDSIRDESALSAALSFYDQIATLNDNLKKKDLAPAEFLDLKDKLRKASQDAAAAIEGELATLAKKSEIELDIDVFRSSEVESFIDIVREAAARVEELANARRRITNGKGTEGDFKLIDNDANRRRQAANITNRAQLYNTGKSKLDALGVSTLAASRLTSREMANLVSLKQRQLRLEEDIFNIRADDTVAIRDNQAALQKTLEKQEEIVRGAERYREVVDQTRSTLESALTSALTGEEGNPVKAVLDGLSKSVLQDFSTRVVRSWMDPVSKGMGDLLSTYGNSFSKLLEKAPGWLSDFAGKKINAVFGDGTSNKVATAFGDAKSWLGNAMSSVGSSIGTAVDTIFGEGTAKSFMSIFADESDESLVGSIFDGSESNPFWVRIKNTSDMLPDLSSETGFDPSKWISDTFSANGPSGDKADPLFVRIYNAAKNKVADVPEFDMFGAVLGAAVKIGMQAYSGGLLGGSDPTQLAGDISTGFDYNKLGVKYDLGGSSILGSGDIGAQYGGSMNISDYLVGEFDTGGVVPGRIGDAQLALVHSGETILPTHKKSISEITGLQGSSSSTVIHLNVTGDVSRQTKATIIQMLPTIANGVNLQNRENGVKK